MNPGEYRRVTDGTPTDEHGTMTLLVYQLGEIKSQLKDGFATAERRSDAIDLKIDLLTKSVSDLERFQAAVEERERVRSANDQNVNARWVPIVMGVIGFLITIAIVILTA